MRIPAALAALLATAIVLAAAPVATAAPTVRPAQPAGRSCTGYWTMDMPNPQTGATDGSVTVPDGITHPSFGRCIDGYWGGGQSIHIPHPLDDGW